MIDETVDRKEGTMCAHEMCRCTMIGEIEGSTYCSEFCENADERAIEGEQCACGHPECDIPD